MVQKLYGLHPSHITKKRHLPKLFHFQFLVFSFFIISLSLDDRIRIWFFDFFERDQFIEILNRNKVVVDWPNDKMIHQINGPFIKRAMRPDLIKNIKSGRMVLYYSLYHLWGKNTSIQGVLSDFYFLLKTNMGQNYLFRTN